MQYTDDKIKCEKCGKISLSSSRYCEICGNQLHIPLDSPQIKGEEFIGIFNSSYSLLANEQHPDRTKYIANYIDDAILKRGKILYEQLWKHVIEYRTFFKGLSKPFDQDIEPFILTDSKFSSSTILAGYAFRIAEELYTQKNTIKISEIYINELINNYKKNYADKNDQTETKLEMLSYALCYDKNYLNFNLINKDKLEEYILNIVSQNLEIELKIRKDFYIAFLKSEDMAKKFLDEEKLFWETFSDFIYGYCLRIGKELLSIS